MGRSENYLHWPLSAVGPNDTVEVTLDNQANVYLLDVENFNKYKNRQRFKYQLGLFATVSPVKITPPRQGDWHVVIDLGGYPGRVMASTKVTRVPAESGGNHEKIERQFSEV